MLSNVLQISPPTGAEQKMTFWQVTVDLSFRSHQELRVVSITEHKALKTSPKFTSRNYFQETAVYSGQDCWHSLVGLVLGFILFIYFYFD